MFNLIRRDPDFGRLLNLSKDLSRMYDNEPIVENAGAWMPAIDVIETEKDLQFVAEVAGLSKDDIDLTIANNVLTLTGEKKLVDDKNLTWHRNERRYGKFSRSFTLPNDVEVANVQARYENGLLYVTLPKSAAAIPQKVQITVK